MAQVTIFYLFYIFISHNSILVSKENLSGAIKVTPAHDPLDYQIAMNHQLEVIEVIDEHGNINETGKLFKV